jgi:hypothetical protein
MNDLHDSAFAVRHQGAFVHPERRADPRQRFRDALLDIIGLDGAET